jgi:ubiquinol-cytochrome c reductase cytochrome b subunit
LGGVVAMLAAIVRLAVLPYLNTSEVRSTAFRPIFRQFYWLFIADALILGWIGGKVAEYPYVQIGQRGTLYYFGFIFVRVPLMGRREAYLMRRPVGAA